MKAFEANFDGLVGLTHHAGLSFGNEASTRNQLQPSNPRLAAKQGLLKMKALADMGYVQGLSLRTSGLICRCCAGIQRQRCAGAGQSSPAGTAAAVSGQFGVGDVGGQCGHGFAIGRQRRRQSALTVANLNNKFHRAIEAPETADLLRAIFRDGRHFSVHDALPQVALFGDEGAANHNRFSADYGAPGVQLFVYGRDGSRAAHRRAIRRARRVKPARRWRDCISWMTRARCLLSKIRR